MQHKICAVLASVNEIKRGVEDAFVRSPTGSEARKLMPGDLGIFRRGILENVLEECRAA